MDALVNSEANARRIRSVEECFGNGVKLVDPGRVLVGEGVLNKQCRKKLKPRQFFLFNDILVYGNIVIHRKKYTTQHIIALQNVKLVELLDEDKLLYGWHIITPNKSFAVHAASLTEKKEWMAHIQKCITSLGALDPKNLAPVWISDDSAPFCMLCTKTKFTFLTRRHHCRKCGSVICGNCSTKRYTLPDQSMKPLRVCDTCYQGLTNPGAPQPQTLDFKFRDRADSEDDSDLYKVPKSVLPVLHDKAPEIEGATATPNIVHIPDEATPVIPVKTKSSTHKPPPVEQGNPLSPCEPRYGSSDDEDDVDHDGAAIETAPTFYSESSEAKV
ncbi:Pleckstrin homology domain-containing family F member 2-like [Oopsacas minuta]|uniref:Pleckstrin homology domain-containing family F member 2-like n=1 Tax=Oopsacas minuta TaxID=111878 RepID=A0AAV7JKZ8_9METZ|nr:Pleckstrin homology domain-containing family F member 2-like [Oopsacas minuta]